VRYSAPLKFFELEIITLDLTLLLYYSCKSGWKHRKMELLLQKNTMKKSVDNRF